MDSDIMLTLVNRYNGGLRPRFATSKSHHSPVAESIRTHFETYSHGISTLHGGFRWRYCGTTTLLVRSLEAVGELVERAGAGGGDGHLLAGRDGRNSSRTRGVDLRIRG
jgi:hypothetical protein